MPPYDLLPMPTNSRGTTGKEPEWPVDDEWIARVNEWCEREGRGAKARLAKASGIEPGTLSGLLAGRYRQSVAVRLINKMVGLPMPTVASGTIDEDDIVAQIASARAQLVDEDARRLVDEQLAAALKTARMLAPRGRS